MNERVELMFGGLSTLLYLVWGISAFNGPDTWRGVMLWCYASANVAILWPVIRRVFC